MKIYIIDDDAICTFLTRQVLKISGYQGQVYTFHSATEALQALRQALPDQLPQLIFLDLNMPQMDGWDFLDALYPYIFELQAQSKIYILTSSLDLVDITRASYYELVSGFIHKPIQPSDVVIVLSRL